MPLLPKVGQNQPLPVPRERVHRTAALENEPGPGLARLHQKVDLRIVAERLKMADSLHRSRDRLLVDDRRPAEADFEAEALHGCIFQNFPLDLAHESRGDLLLALVVGDRELGLLLRENRKIPVSLVGIDAHRKQDPPGEDRHHEALGRVFLAPEALAGRSRGQSRRSDDHAGRCGVHRGEFLARVDPELVDLLPDFRRLVLLAARSRLHGRRVGKDLAHAQLSPGDLEPGEALARGIPRDLENARPERLSPRRLADKRIERAKEHVGAGIVRNERRPEEDREELARGDELRDVLLADRAALHDPVQKVVAAEREVFLHFPGFDLLLEPLRAHREK